MSDESNASEGQDVEARIKAEVEKATAGLSNKNKELLAELKEFRKGQTVDRTEYDAMVSEFEAIKQNYSKLEKKYKEETESLNKALESTKTGYFNSVKESELSTALAKANIAPHFMDAVKALHINSIQTVEKDGKLSAMVGDKSVSDFLGEWTNSDVGKHYVLAPNNNGGGASGSNGKDLGIDVSKLSPMEKMKQGRQQT